MKISKNNMAKKITNEDLAAMFQKQFAEFGEIMATKEDLKRFATKEDLKRFATKEDLKRFATKEEFKELKNEVRDLKDTVIDFAKKVTTTEIERISHLGAHDRMQNEIEKVKKRVTILEKTKK
jgi:DNA invertase Pin-like site-specific DNA recombinase